MSDDSWRQRSFFIPAASIAEAIGRIFALTGAQYQSRGEKRALVALRDALALDIDIVDTNAVMAAKISDALGVEWWPVDYTVRNKVNLVGLNALLEGATAAFHRGSLRQVQNAASPELVGPEWERFRPAISKIEAVTRIASLTGAPQEWLGPGSKEHKSVLTNLADRLLPGVYVDRSSKTRLAASIAHLLSVPWTDTSYSTGETISLEGLNYILAGAERRLGLVGMTAANLLSNPQGEGKALTAALFDGWRAEPWDARTCIEWMRDRGVRGYNENEWQGWFFEARGREVLNAAFPPSRTPVRVRYWNTIFDYSLNRVWDLKAHAENQVLPLSRRLRAGGSSMLLNDEGAIRACVAEQGLGFLVLGGQAIMDEDGSFVTWHRAFKQSQGLQPAASNSGTSRMRKAAFLPLLVEAFWIADTPTLDSAVAAGQMIVTSQGRQAPRVLGAPGMPRQAKFSLRVARARTALRVAEREWGVSNRSRRDNG